MNLLRYEFIEGPDDSINGMLRTLVKELRYNRAEIPADEFKQALPALQRIESMLQHVDADSGEPKRYYISEIMQELDQESEDEVNLANDLSKATGAVVNSLLNRTFEFEDISYTTGKAEHYYWLQFSGYIGEKPVDSDLLLAKEVFRSICNRYNYIFIDLS